MGKILGSEKHNQNNKFKEELLGTEWLGLIVDSKDELFMGRCKIRIFEKFDDLFDDELPWAFPSQSNIFSNSSGDGGAGSFSYPKPGTLVRVSFQNGDFYSPEYHMIQNLNESMQAEIKESYINAQVLVYDEDEDIKIIYTQAKGIFVWNKGSYINISNNGNITINHVGGGSGITLMGSDMVHESKSSINMRTPMVALDAKTCKIGAGAAHPAVKGDDLVTLLLAMATIIDSKLVFGLPAPCIPLVMNAPILSKGVSVAD